jgi:hypothetical protein
MRGVYIARHNHRAAIKPIRPKAPAAAPDSAAGLAAAPVVLGAKALEAALTTLLAPLTATLPTELAPLTPTLPTELAPLTATLPTELAPLAAPPMTDVMVDPTLLV